MAVNLDFLEKFGPEMARISAILFSRHCHRAIFFNFAPPRRTPPFLVRASGASAQHWKKEVNMSPSSKNLISILLYLTN